MSFSRKVLNKAGLHSRQRVVQPATSSRPAAAPARTDVRAIQPKRTPAAAAPISGYRPAMSQTPKGSVQRQVGQPKNARTQPSPKKIALPVEKLRTGASTHVAPTASRQTVQPFKSRTAQATRLYPNLHPGAIEPVNQGSVFRLNSFADQYRLHRVNSHGVNVPNQQYNFVRTREGDMLLHNRYRHPSIAEGKQVLYAGEIFFNNGRLEWWSNGSGHYQPGADDAGQANLPMERFFSYQQIIKGEHTRKKDKK